MKVKDQLAKKGQFYRTVEGTTLYLGYRREKFHRQTKITAEDATEVHEDGFTFHVDLEPHSGFSTTIHVEALLTPDEPKAPEKAKMNPPAIKAPTRGTISLPGQPDQSITRNAWRGFACFFSKAFRLFCQTLIQRDGLFETASFHGASPFR